jgi:hypothetical protein
VSSTGQFDKVEPSDWLPFWFVLGKQNERIKN